MQRRRISKTLYIWNIINFNQSDCYTPIPSRSSQQPVLSVREIKLFTSFSRKPIMIPYNIWLKNRDHSSIHRLTERKTEINTNCESLVVVDELVVWVRLGKSASPSYNCTLLQSSLSCPSPFFPPLKVHSADLPEGDIAMTNNSMLNCKISKWQFVMVSRWI